MKLGCIGDDFTGSSDLANTLAREGMRAVQYVGVPSGPADPGVEAGIVALKSRTIPAAEAVRQSLGALDWLRAQGCEQIVFKICSTFDSTPDGNIGPVTEALADALGAAPVIVCPAFPGTGRTLYQGHLFVGDRLLSESGMQAHPLTPMTDPDIRRWLAAQSTRAVGHVPAATVAKGPQAIAAALQAENAAGRPLVVVDAVSDADLRAIGAAARGLALITGGSGVALGLPARFGCRPGAGPAWRGEAGPCAALSGSCSAATRGQVAAHRDRQPAREISVAEVLDGTLTPERAASWALEQTGLPLLYSSAQPDSVAAAQARFGAERAAQALEHFFPALARALVAGGVTRLVTAGGETSGAVVEGLGLAQLEIGPEIDPGVPALRATPSLVLALKSGNFGAPDFFAKAARVLERDA